jgi:serine/threonine-protein kinase
VSVAERDETATVVLVADDDADLRHDELARTKSFSGGAALISVGGMIAQSLNPSTSWAGTAARVMVATLAIEAALIWFLAARRNAYSRSLMILWGVTAVFCSASFELDAGIFSPMIAANVLGITFFARLKSARLVLGLVLTKIALYIALALLVSLDVIPDMGHFSAHDVPLRERLTQIVLVSAMFLVALVNGRASRRSTIESIELARTAAMQAQRREAQLDEARGDLEVVLRAQRGRGGRYTGETIDDWKVGPLIGRGAMGEVYAAERLGGGRPAAIKFLLATSLEDTSRVARFMRETNVASKLRASGLVDVFAVGQTEDGTPYLAMELLRGEDLAARLRREERLDVGAVVDLVEQIAPGLRAAHEAGVVHRDLKPGNLFCDEKSGWKILDFGICTEEGSSGTLTADGIVGTPAYMAPEQANGEPTKRHTDLFALGAVIYRALTGTPPFAGSTALQLVYAIVYEHPLRPSDLVPELLRDIDRFLAIALAKAPSDRFANIDEMTTALREAAQGRLSEPTRARGDRLSAWRAANHV